MEQQIIEEECAVCQIHCTKFCSGCRKVYYCGAEHQKSHRKKHKPDCFPAILKTDKTLGRLFVASRNIKQGELIFKDKALLFGPSGAEPFFHKICLGCSRAVQTGYVCTKCGWPVCNEICEKMAHHVHFECKIFSDNNVLPNFSKSYEYDFINFLRSLLLKEIEPSKWDEMFSLASHSKARAKSLSATLAVKASVDFLHSSCKLQRFQYETIDRIVGIWSINSFGANPPSGVNTTGRLATLMFPRLCLAAHNCVPNTRGVLTEEMKASKPSYTMELIAALPIKMGEQINTTYTNVNEGTNERRVVLNENYYFSCGCKRCSDPTEFGTFFSAFICPSCKSGGYLLPEDSLDFESTWKCNKCFSANKKYKDLSNTISIIKKEVNCIGNEISANSLTQLEKILKKHQGKTLHTNHWLMIDVEFRLLQRIVGFLPMAKGDQEEFLLTRLTQLCKHCLDIADFIQPGHNTYRGKLLYCLTQAKLQEIIRLTQGADAILHVDRVQTLRKIAEEARDILCREPEGTDDHVVGKLLSDDLKQIDKLSSLLRVQAKVNMFC